MQGILVKAIAGFYYVKAGNTVFECKARGSFKKAGIKPMPGDRVEFLPMDIGYGVIENIMERKNFFVRPTVANVDKLFIISSFAVPSPNTYIIDLMSALAFQKGIEPIIVFNKCDMGDFSHFENIYRKAGLKTYTVSALTESGTAELFAETAGSVCVFTGNSGVGKTSLLNLIFPDLELSVGEVSEKLGRGRHTTREVCLFEQENGGFIADTPGFSALDMKKGEDMEPEKLQYCFPEFKDYIDSCRFASCSHTVEKGCTVIEAVQNGIIPESRFESYKQIYNELKEKENKRYS